ncbi:MAG TPA: hypothetical protein VFW83_08015 [Bryobacteraceae bacterium]|nr:hypothetical protein [Bryobacteraceae bacterium]
MGIIPEHMQMRSPSEFEKINQRDGTMYSHHMMPVTQTGQFPIAKS